MPSGRGLPSVFAAEGLAGVTAPFSRGPGKMAIATSFRNLRVGHPISITSGGPTTIAMHGMAGEALARESCTSPKGLGAGPASGAAAALITSRREIMTSQAGQPGLPARASGSGGPSVKGLRYPICGRGPLGLAEVKAIDCSSGTL